MQPNLGSSASQSGSKSCEQTVTYSATAIATELLNCSIELSKLYLTMASFETSSYPFLLPAAATTGL